MSNRTLEVVTQELGKADALEKENKKIRDERRLEFFSLAEEAVASKTLAQKTISISEFDTEAEALVWIARHYPTWRVLRTEITDDDVVALLEENPEKQPYTFVNPHDKKVYRKQVVSGTPLLDETALQEKDPDLWERITYVPEPERRLKSSDDIDQRDLAKMQEFVYPGPPQIKLAAPRKAKDKELETGNADDG